MNISIVYIYPKTKEINKEINLLRIIDNNIKETIVVYAKRDEDKYRVFMINTLSGKINNIFNASNLDELEILIKKIMSYEKDIKNINNLKEIEKHILNIQNL